MDESSPKKKTAPGWDVSVSATKPRKASKTTIAGVLLSLVATAGLAAGYLHSVDVNLAEMSATLRELVGVVKVDRTDPEPPEPTPAPTLEPIPAPTIFIPADTRPGDLIQPTLSNARGRNHQWASLPRGRNFLVIHGEPVLQVREGPQTLIASGAVDAETSELVVGEWDFGAKPAPDPPAPNTPSPSPTPNDPSVPEKPGETTAVVYVYEKDETAIPSGVLAGLNRLNRERNILATTFEDDIADGDGQVPEQYRAALAAAREKGLPALVIVSDGKAAKVISAPTTEQQVMEAAK